MRESVPTARYSPVCNVLRQWKTSLIFTYRVYRLYDLCGHVLTGDLSIIRDVKLRNLIRKGPVFREQNNIDWEVNLKNCKAS